MGPGAAGGCDGGRCKEASLDVTMDGGETADRGCGGGGTGG